MKQLIVKKIPIEIHEGFKEACSENGMNMRTEIIKFMEKYGEENNKRDLEGTV